MRSRQCPVLGKRLQCYQSPFVVWIIDFERHNHLFQTQSHSFAERQISTGSDGELRKLGSPAFKGHAAIKLAWPPLSGCRCGASWLLGRLSLRVRRSEPGRSEGDSHVTPVEKRLCPKALAFMLPGSFGGI